MIPSDASRAVSRSAKLVTAVKDDSLPRMVDDLSSFEDLNPLERLLVISCSVEPLTFLFVRVCKLFKSWFKSSMPLCKSWPDCLLSCRSTLSLKFSSPSLIESFLCSSNLTSSASLFNRAIRRASVSSSPSLTSSKPSPCLLLLLLLVVYDFLSFPIVSEKFTPLASITVGSNLLLASS